MKVLISLPYQGHRHSLAAHATVIPDFRAFGQRNSGIVIVCGALQSKQSSASGMASPARYLREASSRLFRSTIRGQQVRTVYSSAVELTVDEDYSMARTDLNIFTDPLHLYRALLRQCTYLPDPAARSYMRRRVKARYRDTLRVPLASQRGTALQYKARKGLSLLLRANAGHLKPLERILLLTYGRIGQRRHELMRFLREPNVPVDHLALAKLSLAELEWKGCPTEKMKVMIKSQKALKRFGSTDRPKTKKLQPEIPEFNSWGRPLPRKRVRNIEEEWYAELLDSIVAPLPEPEWDRLRDLAVGQQRWEGLLPRRTIVTCASGDTNLQYVQLKHQDSRDTHILTARFMRRMWQKVFEKCPVMRWDGESMQWRVQWGVSELPEAEMRGRNCSIDLSMFAGVNSRGRITPAIKSWSSAADERVPDMTQPIQ